VCAGVLGADADIRLCTGEKPDESHRLFDRRVSRRVQAGRVLGTRDLLLA